MKKIIFTLLISTCGLAAFCQATQEGVGTVDFPEPASKLKKEQAIEHIRKKLGNDPILIESVGSHKTEHHYVVRDVLIYMNFTRLEPGQKIDISRRKHDDDIVFSKDRDYKSEIRNIGNNTVYITDRSESGNNEECTFLIYKGDGTKVITGMLDFQRSNKEAAKTILEHILTHTKFKD